MGSEWTLSWLGHGCSATTNGVWVDVLMVCIVMVCGRGGWTACAKNAKTYEKSPDNALYINKARDNARENEALL